jgi:hypothetical protein
VKQEKEYHRSPFAGILNPREEWPCHGRRSSISKICRYSAFREKVFTLVRLSGFTEGEDHGGVQW